MKMPPPLFLVEVIIGSNSIEMQSKGMKMRMNRIKTKTWGLGINFSKTEKEKSNIPNSSKLGPEGFDFSIEGFCRRVC